MMQVQQHTYVTFKDVVEFILKNRKGQAFKDYNEELILNGIINACKEGTLLYACRPDGVLVGIVVGKEDKENRVMYIIDILTTERWVLRTFLEQFNERWPYYTLRGLRKGHKEMSYCPTKLLNLTKK